MTTETHALEAAFGHALTFLKSLDRRRVAPADGLEELRRKLARPIPEQPMDAARVIDELVADASGGIMA